MRLLLVEDTLALAAAVADGLRAHGFVVDTCADVESALARARSQPYAAIILDRMLPPTSEASPRANVDGLDVCRALRTEGVNTPILVLTARDAVDDRVEGLDAGADDYLVKPFALSELVARARALTRRQSATRSNVLRAGDVALDLATGSVTRDGEAVDLSAKERLVLTALLRHPGRLLTHAQLVDQVWSFDGEPSPEVVRAHIKNLRRKLAREGSAGIIETVHGVGYRVVA